MKKVEKIDIDISLFRRGAMAALKNHTGKAEVKAFLSDFDGNTLRMYNALHDGSWEKNLSYRTMTKVNNNGKRRLIESPSLETRIYEWVSLTVLWKLYRKKDNGIGLNCKKGCGITAKDRKKSVVSRVKRLYYDRREYEYVLMLDQRKCYGHIKPSHYRRALKCLTSDSAFIDFAVKCSFGSGSGLPIGTPTSPFVHHLMMLPFDLWLKTITSECVRYADNVLAAFRTKEEAQAAKWRIRQYWWYMYGMRAKRHEVAIVPLNTASDFCGYVFHRNPSKEVCTHNKGYVTVRQSTVRNAWRATDKNWGSYFGLMMHADAYRLMRKIENDMNLRQLTERIRINRNLDAPNIDIRDLVGLTFSIRDYEIRHDSKSEANWIKCLVGLPEVDDFGVLTGRTLAREFHGGYGYIIAFLLECEKIFGKEALLPLEDMRIVNQCGYIFESSTNQIEYISDDTNNECLTA